MIEEPYGVREALIKSVYELQNRRQQRRQKSLVLNHYPNRAMTAVSSSNKAAETGSKKAGDMSSQKSGFLIVPCVTFRQCLWAFQGIFLRVWNGQE